MKTARFISMLEDPRRFRLAAGLLVGVLGVALNFGIKGSIALDWQHLYRPEDFKTWGDLWKFLGELQTGISPLWAFFEISGQLLFGTSDMFSYGLYPLSIGLNGFLATVLFARTRLQVVVSAGLSLVFVVAIRFIHKGNTEMYDMLMPSLILGWLAVLQRLRAPDTSVGRKVWLCLLAGLLLTVLELTRTLILPLLPLMVGFTLLSMGPLRLRQVAFLLLPILLLSGGWHLKQILAHGQVHWTNHDGYNMHKSWTEFAKPIPANFVDEPPLYPGGYENINTDRHTAYNKVVRKQVRDAILQQPGRAAVHVLKRLAHLYTPQTRLYSADMPAWCKGVYAPSVWFCALGVLLGLGSVVWQLLRALRSKAAWLEWGKPEVVLWVMTALISCIFAAGESGEDARFLISLLPMLAAAPLSSSLLQRWVGKGVSN